MEPRLKMVAIGLSLALMILIVELVRRRRLREEYSWLWLLTGAVIFVLTVWFDVLVWISALIGAKAPASTLFFFGVLFSMVISLYFSVRISALTDQVKNLTQELAILSSQVVIERSPSNAADS